jgi:putative spermidine/putrescine transport system substrate-binding protein
MRTRRPRIIYIGMVVSLAMVTACSGNGSDADVSTTSGEVSTTSGEVSTTTTSTPDPFAGGEFAGQTVRIGTTPGATQDWTDSYITPIFVEESGGAEVEFVAGFTPDFIAQIAAAGEGQPPIDFIITDGIGEAQAASLGVLAPVDYDIAKNIEQTEDGSPPPFVITFYGIAYNSEILEEMGIEPPTSWEDLWRPEFAGRVAFPHVALGGLGAAPVMAASMIETGGFYNVTAGIDKLAELDTHSVYRSSADAQNDLTSGDLWVAVMIDGRAFQLADGDFPVEFIVPELPDGSVCCADVGRRFVILGSANPELASLFQDIYYRPDTAFEYSKTLRFAAADPQVIERLAEEDSPDWLVRYSPELLETAIRPDWTPLLPLIPTMIDYFSRTIN